MKESGVLEAFRPGYFRTRSFTTGKGTLLFNTLFSDGTQTSGVPASGFDDQGKLFLPMTDLGVLTDAPANSRLKLIALDDKTVKGEFSCTGMMMPM